MSVSFDAFFQTATGGQSPYAYQRRLANHTCRLRRKALLQTLQSWGVWDRFWPTPCGKLPPDQPSPRKK